MGGTRRPGTTVLIEDVAFPLKELPEATADLQELLVTNEYHDACIYGHALEGNFHFIISQSFDSPEQVARYEKLMDEVKTLVVDKYDGSLKAEHGTRTEHGSIRQIRMGRKGLWIHESRQRVVRSERITQSRCHFQRRPTLSFKTLQTYASDKRSCRQVHRVRIL